MLLSSALAGVERMVQVRSYGTCNTTTALMAAFP